MSAGDSGYGSRNRNRNNNRNHAMAQPTMNNNNITFSATKINQQSQPLQYDQYPFPDQSYREPYGTSVSAIEESLPDSSFLTETPSDEVHQQDFDSDLNPPAIDLAGLGLDQGNPYDIFPMNLESAHPMTPNTPPFSVDPDFISLFGDDNPWNGLPREDNMVPNQTQKYSKTPRHKRRRVESDSGIDTQQSSTPSGLNQSHSEMQSYTVQYNTSLHPPTAGSAQQDHINSPYPQEQQAEANSFSASARRNTSPSLSQQSPSQPSQKAQRKSTERHTCDKCPQNFSTINDLDRHRKGVHQSIKHGESIWRCKIIGCTQAEKIWPRKDNFLQHLKRMHFNGFEPKDADTKAHEVVDKYEEKYDVQKHGLPAGSTRGGPRSRPTQEPAPPARVHKRASVSGAPMIQQPFMIGTTSQGLNMSNQYPRGTGPTRSKRPSSSMMNNDNWTNVDMSSIGMSLTTPRSSQYLQPPQSGGISRNTGRSWDVQTVPPNVGSRLRQQQEIREHDRAVPVVSRNVPEELNLMGQGLEPPNTVDPSLLFNTGTQTINLDSTSGVQAPDPDPEKTLDEVLKNLSSKQKDMLRSLPPDTRAIFFDKVVEESHEGQDSPDRSVPKSSTKKQADGEKKLKCDQWVEKKGEKGEKDKIQVRCSASFNSPSELRKHSKRHEKRFGCTFDRCYSKFGTKWEWKRHEVNQHIQHEAWRCRYTDGKTSCQKLFGSQKKFEEHLKQQHFFDSVTEGFKKEVEQCHLLKKWLGSFWCGYCQGIVQCMKDFGRDMDDERVEHIGAHIEQGKKSEDWVELAAEGKTKREMKVIKDNGFRLMSHSTKPESTEQSSRQQTEDEEEYDDDDDNDSDGTEADEFDDTNSPAELQQSRGKLPKLDVHAAQNASMPPSSQGSHTPLPNTPSRIQVYSPNNLLLADHMLDDMNARPMQQRRAYTDNDATGYQYQHQHYQSPSHSQSQPHLQPQPLPQLQQFHTLPRGCCSCGQPSIYQNKCQLPGCQHECEPRCFQMSQDSFVSGGFPNDDDAGFGYYGDVRMMGYS